MSTPSAASVRGRRFSNEFNSQEIFKDFSKDIFIPFVEQLAESLEETLEISPVCRAFSCLDMRNFPPNETELGDFGEEDLDTLLDFYGEGKRTKSLVDGFEVDIHQVDPVVNKNEAKREYKIFKEFSKGFRINFKEEKKKEMEGIRLKLESLKKNNNESRDKRKKRNLEKELERLKETKITLKDLYSKFEEEDISAVMPNIKKLLLLANISPVGNAVVERAFSLMKITKTYLRNRYFKNLNF